LLIKSDIIELEEHVVDIAKYIFVLYNQRYKVCDDFIKLVRCSVAKLGFTVVMEKLDNGFGRRYLLSWVAKKVAYTKEQKKTWNEKTEG
jgi:hypothetical protein